jgi:site-specific DNA-methyltransferase (adenine-specific)
MVEAHRLLADDGSLWLLISNEWAWDLTFEAVENIGFHLRQPITWYESFGVNMGEGCEKFNRTSRALLWLTKDKDSRVFNSHAPEIWKPSARLTRYKDARANSDGKLWDDVWGIDPPIPRLVGTCSERIPGFPTQLPLALLRPIVACASNPGELVVDPFCGSGTTGVVCCELEREFIGIELSPEFASLARKRLFGVVVDAGG